MMALVWLFVILLGVGGSLAVWALARGPAEGNRASEILAERLARGDISPDEYRDRKETIGGNTGNSRPAIVAVAVGLIVAGLVGGLVATVTAAAPAWNGMHAIMNRMTGAPGMDSRMGEMMGGSTERRAPSPQGGAASERVVAGDFFFRQNEIRVRAHEAVNVRFTNGGRMFHTFTVEELDFELRARPGATISGALRDAKPGTYKAVCTVPGHAQAGMRATIRVL